MKKSVRTFAALMMVAATLSFATVASAQGDAQKAALAQSLFEEAQGAMNAKNYGEACPKLERVVELIPDGVGAKMELAKCYEGQGRLASAFGMYVATEGAAMRANQSDRANEARSRMDALKPRIARVTIDVPADIKTAPGFSLKRDGVDMLPAEYGSPVAMDKGEHVLIAAATGRASWEKRFSVNDGDKFTVKVELGKEGSSGTIQAPTTGQTGGTGGTGTVGAGGTTGDKKETNFFSPLRIAGLGIGIGGVVVAVAGIGLGVHAKGLYDDSNETLGCTDGGTTCTTQEGVDQRADALMFANVSTGLTIVGGVLAAGGIIMFAVAPSEEVKVGVGPGYLSLTKSF